MTPLQIIATIWMIGTCIAFVFITKNLDKSTIAMKSIKENPTFTPEFMRKIVIVLCFFFCLFLWWYIGLRMLWEWIRFWLIINLAKLIVRLSFKSKKERVNKLMEIVNSISPKDTGK